VTDLPLLQAYLQKRIVNQREYFSRKCSQHRRHAWYFEGGAKLSLALALIIAAVHLGTLWAGDAEPEGARILIVAAIFFPIVGAALVGLLSIFGCRRLSVSYAHHAEEMERLEKELRALESNMITSEKPIDVLDLNFRRLLLETERVLSNELRLWWMFMNPELPRASG
jgi:SMODS and SLOG-associating 2TM effector domain 1